MFDAILNFWTQWTVHPLLYSIFFVFIEGCEYIENTDSPDAYNEEVHGEEAGINSDQAYDILYDSPVIVSNKIYQG